MQGTHSMNRFIALAGVAAAVMLAGGCATFVAEDPDMINDRLRPGPGLLSGAGGELVIFPTTPDPAKPKAD
jgi:hypothetical protein